MCAVGISTIDMWISHTRTIRAMGKCHTTCRCICNSMIAQSMQYIIHYTVTLPCELMVVCSVDSIVDMMEVVPVDGRLHCGGVYVESTGVTGPPISTTVTVGDTNRLFMPYCEPNKVSDSSSDNSSGGSLGLRAR